MADYLIIPIMKWGALSGSPCDSLTGITEFDSQSSTINVFYQPAWQIAFVNYNFTQVYNFTLVHTTFRKIIYERKGVNYHIIF